MQIFNLTVTGASVKVDASKFEGSAYVGIYDDREALTFAVEDLRSNVADVHLSGNMVRDLILAIHDRETRTVQAESNHAICLERTGSGLRIGVCRCQITACAHFYAPFATFDIWAVGELFEALTHGLAAMVAAHIVRNLAFGETVDATASLHSMAAALP